MGRLIYITGGTRSGKSAFAEEKARGYDSAFYIATARYSQDDEEMLQRIATHQKRRPSGWQTIEEDVDVASVLERLSAAPCVLIESIGTLVNNTFFDSERAGEIDWERSDKAARSRLEAKCLKEADALIQSIVTFSGDVLVVSEEVGLGMVSAYPMGRAFSDILGKINQLLAQAAMEAYFVVSGLPIRLK